MSYGESWKKLSPCSNETVASALWEAGCEPSSVLDVGCGRGDRLCFFSSEFPMVSLCGIDPDEDNLSVARSVCPSAELQCASAESLPFADGSFSLVLCECVFSLLDHPETALEEFARVLAPGGFLLLSDLCLPDGGETEMISECGPVRRLYPKETLSELPARAEFTLVSFRDCRDELLNMLGQMLFDGSLCGCMDASALAALRRAKAGYGLWLWRRDPLQIEEKTERLGAVIAAAGLSSRMGDFKPLLPFGNTSVIGRCIRNLRAVGISEIVVVTGHRAPELEAAVLPLGVTVVRNPDYASTGMFESLCIGLRALSPECTRVFLTPGDVPAVKEETLYALLQSKAPFVRPACGGKTGHPILLKADWIPAILDFKGEGGLNAAVMFGPGFTDVAVEDPTAMIDADTPADYHLLLEMEHLQ